MGMALGEGGIQSHIAGLTGGLTKRGHSVRVVRSSTLPPMLAALRYTTRLAGRLDIVHVQGLGDLPSLAAGYIAGTSFAGGSVVTAHGSGDSYWNKGRLNYVARRELVQRFDTLISVSGYLERRLTQILGDSPPRRVIYSGVDTELFAPGADPTRAKGSFGLEGKFVLLCVGRLSPEKGVSTLVNSLPAIRRGIPNTKVLVCGRGSEESELKAQAQRLDVGDMIDFRGPVPQPKLPPYYDAADLVVVPSNKEAFPIVNLEAMSMAKAVVASDVGGIPEVVKHNETGLLVPPSDPPSLADAVLRVHGDPGLRERLGTNGRRLVEERFTWDAIAGEVEKAYLEILR